MHYSILFIFHDIDSPHCSLRDLFWNAFSLDQFLTWTKQHHVCLRVGPVRSVGFTRSTYTAKYIYHLLNDKHIYAQAEAN